MVDITTIISNYAAVFWIFIIIAAVWEAIWKGIAMWKCGRNNQLPWFIVILIFNTLGILPIIYLLFFQKRTRMEKRAFLSKAAKQAKKRKK